MGHDAVDVVDHRGAQGAAAEAAPPAGLLGVPGQGVATDPHAVLGGPVVDRVTGPEVELAAVGFGRVGFHLVDGRHHVELTVRDGEEALVVEAVPAHRGAEVPPAALGGGFQRGPGRAGQVGASDGGHGHRGHGDQHGTGATEEESGATAGTAFVHLCHTSRRMWKRMPTGSRPR